MTKIPLVAMTTWRRPLPTFLGSRTDLHTLGSEYPDAVRAAGGRPLLLPRDLPATAADALDGVAALVLCGGDDVHPRSYGSAHDGTSRGVSAAADTWEIALAREARERGVPTLGICRGSQILNVAFGGTLRQEICSPTATEEPRAGAATGEPHAEIAPTSGWRHRPLPADSAAVLADRHRVRLREGSRLREIYRTAGLLVNTIHHQAVDRVADGFAVSATAPDGVVEAIEHTGDWWAVGVQWHPEKLAARRAATGAIGWHGPLLSALLSATRAPSA
ncbi:gamma-glutamyl-gamma-aminobutyrate hydrolase family protein [Streptosporangium sp. NPDC051022]|uniref:gamma-glutamyl-gamma-aminobutyrate hydrolase family protein n=1 Tax=Streptosporangium sp. NPDC051022 TaxID=3155752 RepID=UPI00343BF7E4